MVEASVFKVDMKATNIGEVTEFIVAQNASQAITTARQLHPEHRVSALEETVSLAYLSNSLTGK